MTKEIPEWSALSDRASEPAGAGIRHSSFVIPPAGRGFSFIADWDRTLMLHYEVPPAKLQPFIPFELDVRDGKAYVSLVAFTMRGLRPRATEHDSGLFRRRGAVWRKALTLVFSPIATHEFLNVRTYVRHGGNSGIYFIAEWLPNALSVPLGRPLFGLPYRLARVRYLHEHERGILFGEVRPARGRGVLRYRARVRNDFCPCASGSLTEWLMERYTAFTEWRGWKRLFRVRHGPWPQCPVEVEILDDSLLSLTGGWSRFARFIGANYSPGLCDVAMSAPHTLRLPGFKGSRAIKQS